MKPAAALLLLVPAIAMADADEASLSVAALGSLYLPEDGRASGRGDPSLAAGVDTRFSFATHDYFAYEARLGVLVGGQAELPSDGATGDRLSRGSVILRPTLGLTMRFGVRWVPTLGLGVGYQLRFLGAGTYVDRRSGLAVARAPSRTEHAPVAYLSAGLDRRLGRSWAVGASVRAVGKVVPTGYGAVEGLFAVRYYWYPRW